MPEKCINMYLFVRKKDMIVLTLRIFSFRYLRNNKKIVSASIKCQRI